MTPNAMKEIGWSEVDVDNAELAREWIGNEPAFELFQWHGDTFDLPAGARRFLTSRLCANQAFVVDREHHAHLGMQFHVEMTPQLVSAWVTDPSGVHEIAEAFERQGGAGVQRAAEIVRNVDERTQRMSRLADRIYQRWLRGVRSQRIAPINDVIAPAARFGPAARSIQFFDGRRGTMRADPLVHTGQHHQLGHRVGCEVQRRIAPAIDLLKILVQFRVAPQ